MSTIVGKISQIVGPVIDVSFADAEKLPNIMDALVITKSNGQKVILECQQHIGEDAIRAISMDATDGLSRGMEVTSLNSPILKVVKLVCLLVPVLVKQFLLWN